MDRWRLALFLQRLHTGLVPVWRVATWTLFWNSVQVSPYPGLSTAPAREHKTVVFAAYEKVRFTEDEEILEMAVRLDRPGATQHTLMQRRQYPEAVTEMAESGGSSEVR